MHVRFWWANLKKNGHLEGRPSVDGGYRNEAVWLESGFGRRDLVNAAMNITVSIICREFLD